MSTQAPPILHRLLSICLGYPDAELLGMLPQLREVLGEHRPSEPAARFRFRAREAAVSWQPVIASFLDQLETTEPAVLQRNYVETFDLSRKHSLYLSYWTDGDTRRRGEVLGRFKAAYRDTGFLVQTGGELPDYLPMVLECAAVADAKIGTDLLVAYRPGIELLRMALEEAASAYAPLLGALCSSLPGPGPGTREQIMAMAGAGPPVETVGLEPYDARLLPVRGV